MDRNSFIVQGFMTRTLKLSGNELCAFAIIYGFSKDTVSEYLGSTKYLMETLNITKPTAMSALNGLIEKNLIIKRVQNIGGIAFNRYSVNMAYLESICGVREFLPGSKEILPPSKESLPGGKEILPSNINRDINRDNNKKDIYTSLRSVSISKEVSEIVDYLNLKANTSYRASTDKTKRLVNARFNEGWTIDDFKTVIDFKVKEWANTSMAMYLRPETLFGTKFESYLNQSKTKTTVYNNPYLNRDNTFDDPDHMWD